VIYRDQFVVSEVEIPRKCSTCVYIAFDRVRGFCCSKDSEKWGLFPPWVGLGRVGTG
jgi:hypothetical protein